MGRSGHTGPHAQRRGWKEQMFGDSECCGISKRPQNLRNMRWSGQVGEGSGVPKKVLIHRLSNATTIKMQTNPTIEMCVRVPMLPVQYKKLLRLHDVFPKPSIPKSQRAKSKTHTNNYEPEVARSRR